ncbi:MAG: D-aminoacyl-tRNA deacylase [Deltaproteobacteria bacterium]|nr:D-aminoacyl-tRNA deacylase [Deltaproteobacteria bacterium]
MITLVQRVAHAQVRVDGLVIASIASGLLLFVGVEKADGDSDADTTARKVAALRIFEGRTPMDRTVAEVQGALLVVSQFTLAGSIHKGNRPSFDNAADPALATKLYERVADQLRAIGLPVQTGRFAADMKVELLNDGPITFVVQTRSGALLKQVADLPT